MEAQELIAIRKGLKMSRTAFAKEVGLSLRMMQYLENGDHAVDKRTENAVHWVEHQNKWRKKLGEK